MGVRYQLTPLISSFDPKYGTWDFSSLMVSADTRNPHSIAAGVPAEISEIDLFAGTINYQLSESRRDP